MVGLVPLNSKLPLYLHSAVRGDFRSQVRAWHEGEAAPPTPKRTETVSLSGATSQARQLMHQLGLLPLLATWPASLRQGHPWPAEKW